MGNNEFRSLLQLVVAHWEHSARAYAEVLNVQNTAVKNLLTDHIAVIPADLKKEVEAIIEHYTIWAAKWDDLKNKLNPAPDDEFVFENEHRFPRAEAQKLKAALNYLS